MGINSLLAANFNWHQKIAIIDFITNCINNYVIAIFGVSIVSSPKNMLKELIPIKYFKLKYCTILIAIILINNGWAFGYQCEATLHCHNISICITVTLFSYSIDIFIKDNDLDIHFTSMNQRSTHHWIKLICESIDSVFVLNFAYRVVPLCTSGLNNMWYGLIWKPGYLKVGHLMLVQFGILISHSVINNLINCYRNLIA